MILDIVVAVILFLSMLVAWFRGFIREVLTICSLAGAAVAALYGSPHIIPHMTKLILKDREGEDAYLFGMIPLEFIAIGLSYLLAFVVVFIILSLMTHMLSKAAKEAGLGALDRSLGVLFGMLRAIILIGLLFIPFNVMMEDAEKKEWFGDSITLPYVDYTARLMRAAIPNPMADKDKDAAESEKADADPAKRDFKQEALDAIQEKAKQNAAEAARILRGKDERPRTGAKPRTETEQPQDNTDGTGYAPSQRDALDDLMQRQR